MKENSHHIPAPNIYQYQNGQTLTPLILGEIQYHKMKKEHDILQVRNEIIAQEVSFGTSDNWTTLLKHLKKHKDDNKVFKSVINYDLLKWNSVHFNKSGKIV